jgi:flavin reductase (DIM6/NTAB) family NADH-FMN oxidoreductase RutF
MLRSQITAVSRKRNILTIIARQRIEKTMSSATEPASAATDAEWTSLDPSTDLTVSAAYSLCISSVVPRPIAVITTKDPKSGVLNCAPYSYTSLSGHDPVVVTHGLTISRANGKKDTQRNIEESGEWVYNVVSTNYLEKSNECAAALPFEVDETAHAGLELLHDCSNASGIPRLKDARVAMECKLIDKKEIFNDEGRHTTTIVIGRVTRFHLHSSILKEGQSEKEPRVDLEALQAVGRAGDITYWPVGTSPETVRPMERP